MHFPAYLWLGPIPVHPHLVFETLAYAVGARLYALLKRRTGDPLAPEDRWWVVAAAFVGAALGGKVLVWLDHPALTLAHLGEPLALLDGQSVVGALICGLIAVEWTKRRIGVTRSIGDLFANPLAVGNAVAEVTMSAPGEGIEGITDIGRYASDAAVLQQDWLQARR